MFVIFVGFRCFFAVVLRHTLYFGTHYLMKFGGVSHHGPSKDTVFEPLILIQSVGVFPRKRYQDQWISGSVWRRNQGLRQPDVPTFLRFSGDIMASHLANRCGRCWGLSRFSPSHVFWSSFESNECGVLRGLYLIKIVSVLLTSSSIYYIYWIYLWFSVDCWLINSNKSFLRKVV